MTASIGHLGQLVPVAFSSLMLDPNNPRIAPRPAPGYLDAAKLFDPEVQASLPDRVFKAYKADDLERTITNLGWTPVDPIIVWTHPDRTDLNLVVEGNARVSILRRARIRLQHASEKLAKLKSAKTLKPEVIAEQEEEVNALAKLVQETEKVEVQHIQAASVAELVEKLPLLLGVRHVSGARNWTPYATNVYVSSHYEEQFRHRYPGSPLALDDQLIKEVAQVFSLRAANARRMIQAASAFDHFKLGYEDKVVQAGNKLDDEDQYFIDNILQHKYAWTQFGFQKDDLKLSDEASEALFQWAFSKPRSGPSGNTNVLKIAEDIRLWARIAKYDADHGTTFATRLDVENPTEAPTVSEIEFAKLQHEQQMSPLSTFSGLVDALEKLPAASLHSQADMLAPLLAKMKEHVDHFLHMIEAKSA
jgi:hypothetical protein